MYKQNRPLLWPRLQFLVISSLLLALLNTHRLMA